MTLVEKLAELEHDQWASWARKLIQTEPNLSPERVERWRNLLGPFDSLSEEWKEYDRAWARQVVQIVMLHLNEETED